MDQEASAVVAAGEGAEMREHPPPTQSHLVGLLGRSRRPSSSSPPNPSSGIYPRRILGSDGALCR